MTIPGTCPPTLAAALFSDLTGSTLPFVSTPVALVISDKEGTAVAPEISLARMRDSSLTKDVPQYADEYLDIYYTGIDERK